MRQSVFDEIILDNLKRKYGAEFFGYKSDSNRVYGNYYTNFEFDKFAKIMEENYSDHFIKYIDGKGSEMKPSVRNGVQVPPKMASVASSSRFCYLALRNGASHIKINTDVKFEYECPIKDKPLTQPQLDAYSSSTNTYVEVKCHEIFDYNKKKTLGAFYANYIYGYYDNIGFNLPIDVKPNAEFTIPYTYFGLEKFPKHFDLKQFICHLLGIACQNSNKDKSSTLTYLFFRPITDNLLLNEEILNVFTTLQKEMISIFTSPVITSFCKEHKILLKAYYEYADEMEALTPANTHPIF